jgi:Flp pilus assembly protein TadD
VEFGLVAWELGDYHRVLQCSSRVTALDARRYEGPLLHGVAARHHGRLDEAIEHLTRAATLAGNYALPYILLGNTFEVNGQHENARQAYEDALSIEPDNNEAKILLARLDHEQRLRAASVDVLSP